MTKQQLTNIKTLRDFLATVPEDEVDLESFRCVTSCGTTFCALGWAATLPHFQEQGMCPDPNCGVPLMDIKGYPSNPVTIASILFGRQAFSYLFETYGQGPWDRELRHAYHKKHGCRISHKDLALARLDKALQEWTI